MLRFTLITLLLLGACGNDPGDTSAGSTSSDPDTTAPGTTEASVGGTLTSSGETTSTTADTTTADATSTPTTSTFPGTTTSGPDDTTDTSATTAATADTTTADVTAFNRFLTNRSAGPCPPDADCDGFIELLANRTLRVEKFGDIPDPVTEVEISQEDFDAAVPIFADPELFALLSQDDIICDPPTDIFEDMLVDLDGNVATNSTTACQNPPIAAARDKANELADKYVP